MKFVLLFAAALLSAASPKRKPKPPAASARIVNPEALAPFAAALKENRVVRVLHFGDSHTAADFWTGRLRARLQARYGDAGPGLLMPGRPWRGYPHEGVRIVAGRTWEAASLKSGEGRVGLAGAALVPTPGEALAVEGIFRETRLHLLVGSAAPRLTLGGQEVEPRLLAEDPCGLRIYTAASAESVLQEAACTPPEDARVLGLELRTGAPGVLYEELGLNGAELADLAAWDPALRKALLAQAQPDLLVVAYGTNDQGRADLTNFRAQAETLFRALRAESGAPLLVVGPLDRLGRKKRARAALRTGAAKVITDLKAAARAVGAAFWDARQAMGSIQTWRRRGLAQKDLVHLNAAGYRKLGDLMAEELLRICP